MTFSDSTTLLSTRMPSLRHRSRSGGMWISSSLDYFGATGNCT